MKFSPPPKEAEHLTDLHRNAARYFSEKFKKCESLHGTQWATFADGTVLYFKRIHYWDSQLGILFRVIVIDNLGYDLSHVNALAQYKFNTPDIKDHLAYCTPSNSMPMAPKIFIYTNELKGSIMEVRDAFAVHQPNTFVEVIEEDKLHKTIFISYGGPDEKYAAKINDALKKRGIDTWFFPIDSIPGDKLHRVMSEGVNKYDRTLLICSKDSVLRRGVTNEIERMLEREASEGGSDIIIPVALDEYIFDEWTPERADLKQQLTSRVVSKINDNNFDSEIEKIIFALRH